MATTTARGTAAARVLREAMADTLRAGGYLRSPAVDAAFRTVPRERFAPPGTDPAAVYDAFDAVVTKHGPDGRAISSISAPSIQASMIEQARPGPGMRVLEIGSGGVNAAYLAELVGPDGRVVTIDIDPDVTDRAAACLDATGYGSRVRVVQGDAHHGVPDEAPFDVIMVTVQCWDIAPAWLAQLKPGGVLVLPMTIRGDVGWSIAFRHDGDRDQWSSGDGQMCGFVAMQGVGHHGHDRLTIAGEDGTDVVVAFDTRLPAGVRLDREVLAGASTPLWSGVSFPHGS